MLKHKVILVTGAGRGVGRDIALLCAAQGAKVIVNDLGGQADGEGEDKTPAMEVVGDIKETGGEAAATMALLPNSAQQRPWSSKPLIPMARSMVSSTMPASSAT